MKRLLIILSLCLVASAQDTGLLLTGASSGASLATFTDNFTRANGALGSNWTNYPGESCALTIASNLVQASSVPCVHSISYYTAPGAVFAANQFSRVVLGSSPVASPLSTATLSVRANGSRLYNDAYTITSNQYRLGVISGSTPTDFAVTSGVLNPASGNTLELDVAGSNPVFFWSFLNGTINATGVDTGNLFATGVPGVGVVENSTTVPVIKDSTWTGGSLGSFGGSSDSFQRANAGWLGVNWWFSQLNADFTAQMILSSNSAALNVSGTNKEAVAVWTTPFGSTQASSITLGAIGGTSDWQAAVVRYAMPAALSNFPTFYLVLDINKSIQLYEYGNGGSGYVLLSTLGTFGGTVNTLELDASGTGPVSLVVKVNGTQFGSTFNDSTYQFNGAYEGFGISSQTGGSATTVTAWSGS